MNPKYLVSASLIFMIVSCATDVDKSNANQTEKENTMNTEQKKLTDFGTDYTHAWNSQKPENVASFFTEDGSLLVNNGSPLRGRAAITEFANGFMTAFPDMTLTMDSLIIKPNETQYHWSFIGTNTGPNGTGNQVIFSGFERWTLAENGKIKVSIGSFDEEDYARQVNGIQSE
jgi:predicted ester cyclase